MPRFTPDGERNRIHLQRLKEKLGNRSNASSEVEFRGAWARLVGEEGRGVPTIIEMVNHTRLDCSLGGAAGMRQGVAHAIHHSSYRSAFGRLLVDQPLMRNVLADLAIESEAATISSMRLARSYDEAIAGNEAAQELKRLANAVLKYWICKRAPMHAAEALECLGGNGYVEESGMPRLYREAPLNSIWEGSGNVQCLDVLRGRSARARWPNAVLTSSAVGCATTSPRTRKRSKPAPAASWSEWRSRFRHRFWSATATRRSPTRSARRASRATPVARSGRCLPARTSAA
jgi:putative acyl-CoA dehydrogenase